MRICDFLIAHLKNKSLFCYRRHISNKCFYLLYFFSDMDNKCRAISTTGVGYDPTRAYRTLVNVEDIRTCILACTMDKECEKATYDSGKMCHMYQGDHMWPMPNENSVAFSKMCDESK